MTNLEYLLAIGVIPVATVILGLVLMYLTREKSRHPKPGE